MADSIILPATVAQQLQIDLTSAPSGSITVVGGSLVPVRYAQVILTLQTPRQSCRWPAWVGFAASPRWLFGHFGGLEFFHFTLDAVNEELILVPRDNLPPAP